MGITLLTVNRLRSVPNPLEIWSKNTLRHCYLCQWGLSLIGVIPLAFQPYKVVLHTNANVTYYGKALENTNFEVVYVVSMLFIAWVLIFICIGIYIAIFIVVHRDNQKSGADPGNQRQSRIRLVLMSSVLFILMFGLNLYLIFMLFHISLNTMELLTS